MIKAVGVVTVYVSDQDRAKAFYTEKLGMELRNDLPMGPDSRWLTVAPVGSETEISLYKMDENWEHYRGTIGKPQSTTFKVTDIEALYEDLKAKGVEIEQPPKQEFWGTFMVIRDPDKNGFILSEDPK